MDKLNFSNLNVNEINAILNKLTPEEKELALSVLNEYANEGHSNTLDAIILEDYAEIPVDIETFVDSNDYLGYAWHDAEGKSKLYPYWRKELKKLFPDNITTSVNNTILSGSRGRGKSEIACLILAYLLHRVLCLKDPVAYFNLKPTEKIVFAFMNIKLELAEEIALSKFQNTIQSSPWFMNHGYLEGRSKKIWYPQKYKGQIAIDIKIGSQSDDLIGLPIYACLDGDTKILTSEGIFKIKDLENKSIRVPSLDSNNNLVLSESCTVKPTKKTVEEYQIELEDGSIIKCTANHRFRLVNGEYKEAKYLTKEDELTEVQLTPFKKREMKITSIEKVIHDTPKQFYDVINANPYNNFLIATNSTFICSHNCFFDEISFIKNKDVEKQKEKANDMIDTAIGGMKTRFVHKGKNPTMLILASSKRSDKSFLEEHMKKKLKSEKTNVYISDGSVWEVKPKGTYKDETFAVAVGNKFLTSIILPEGADEKEYRLKGYVKIIHPPVDFKADFIDDIDRALCDFAGISSSSLTKYISGQAVSEVINTTLQNAFTNEILTIGTGPEDREVQYYHFFDKSRIPRELLSKPLFIHLDMSLTGDKTGIAGVFIKGKKTSADPNLQDRDLFYTLGFAVSIKAPKGRQISFEKNRNFIRWLKDQGFIIKGISCDTYQSADLQQILKAEGFPIETLSVDRVGTNQICIPYQSFKSAIYEKRIELFEDELLIEEVTNLERNNDTGKIDHPDGGCFTGDTKVKLTDGRSLSFLELIDEYKQGKENYVYSMNLESKKIEPKRIVKAWKTLENQPLVRITLDNGESIECTLNHKFMLRNGEYMEAQELLPGDSLMSLYASHEVMMLQFISKKADVYDVEVEDNHNFALNAGIFVHNSKDKSDAVCGAVYTASQYAEEFAYRYGESEALKLTVELNSSDYSSSDHEQITLAWEEELKRINGTFSSMKSQDTINANNSFDPTENYSLWNDDIIM